MGFFKPDVEKLGKKRDVRRLIKALKYPEVDIQKMAMIYLSVIGDPRAVEPLANVLMDENMHWKVRFAAASALGYFIHPQAIYLLAHALKDKDEKVRLWVVKALRNIGAPRNRFVSKEEHEKIRIMAEKALGYALMDENDVVQYEAMKALGKLRDLYNNDEYSAGEMVFL